jgi:hypothetical protein
LPKKAKEKVQKIACQQRRITMSKPEDIYEVPNGQQELASVGNDQLGIYKHGFQFKENSLNFFRLCVGEDTYERAMNSEAGKQHHYVAARVFLNQEDWEKFV